MKEGREGEREREGGREGGGGGRVRFIGEYNSTSHVGIVQKKKKSGSNGCITATSRLRSSVWPLYVASLHLH